MKYWVCQEKFSTHQNCVSYVKMYWYNPKHIYLKLNDYVDNGHRKEWQSNASDSAEALSHAAHVVGLDENAHSATLNQYFNKPGYHMPCTVLRTLSRSTTLVRVFMWFSLMALCHSHINYLLSTGINIIETKYSCRF
jgi:hypothetical protein